MGKGRRRRAGGEQEAVGQEGEAEGKGKGKGDVKGEGKGEEGSRSAREGAMG